MPLAGVSGANGTRMVCVQEIESGLVHRASGSSANCHCPSSDSQPSRLSCGRGYPPISRLIRIHLCTPSLDGGAFRKNGFTPALATHAFSAIDAYIYGF